MLDHEGLLITNVIIHCVLVCNVLDPKLDPRLFWSNTMNTLNATGKSMFDFISKFRTLSNEIQAQTIQTFLYVAMSEKREIPMSELADALGLSQASVSRNVSFYSKINRHRVKGVGLLGSREDPKERRKKLVYLTNKGNMFFNNLEDKWN